MIVLKKDSPPRELCGANEREDSLIFFNHEDFFSCEKVDVTAWVLKL